jgi:hypothetical protein
MGMDHDAAAWSAEEIAAFIQQMSRASVEQFVRQHQHLQKFALAGFNKQLPKDYALRIARVLAQRAKTSQQDLKHLLERWRQDHPTLCQAIQQLEPPLGLEMLLSLIEQHGGQDVLSALRTDPHAEKFNELCTALRDGMARGEISRVPAPPAPSEAPAHAGKPDEQRPAAPAAEPTESSHPQSAVRRTQPRTGHTTTLPRPALLPNGASAPPQSTADYISALEGQVQALTTIEQNVASFGMQLAQPTTTHNPLAIQRAIEKLTTAQQRLSDGLSHFAALEEGLLERLGAEVQQAEATGLAAGLAAQLPTEPALATSDEARAHLQMIQQVRQQLSAALARHEQRRAALTNAPAVIERLLDEIEGLEGETGPLRANLVGLKTMIAERASDQQTERALKRAELIQEKAIQLRDKNLQNWTSNLQRACRDAEIMLHQSLHLPTDLPEVTNLQQALEQAQSLLATSLPLSQPLPIPFPPAQIMGCHAALRKHNDHLRQALAAYNPHSALAALEDFEQIENPQPNAQKLREIGAALVGAASLPSGYSGLIWRVGSKLLMLLDDATAEQFYERYGYAAVATGLAASLRVGDFPLGLAFAEHLFYTGADLDSVFTHPRVQETLSEVCASSQLPSVANNCFAEATLATRKAALAFLAAAAEFDLPQPLRFQLSGALLASANTPEERAQAGEVFIETLLSQEQPLNAYCVWRALAQEQPTLYSLPAGLQALYSLIWRLTLDSHAPVTQLAALCSDGALQPAGFVVPGVALALSLGSLLVARANHLQGEELTQLYAEMLRDHHYPVLSDTLLMQLPSHHELATKAHSPEAEAREKAIQTISAEFTAALAEADRRIQVSHYRFAPTKQMRNQLDIRLKAALAALQQPEEAHDDLVQRLADDDPDDVARALIEQEERNRRQFGYESIEGDDLKKLRKDLENVASHLSLAAEKRAQLLGLGLNVWSIKRSSGGMHISPNQETDEEEAEWQPKDEALLAELHRMLGEVPQARHLLQHALPYLALEMS